MAAQDFTTIDSVLQEDYLPAIRSQLNDKNQFTEIISKNTEDFEGRRAVLSVHLGRGAGYGARGDTGASMPTAGYQRYGEERIPTRRNYGRIKVEFPAIEATKTNKASFGRAIDLEIKGKVSDMKFDYNRQALGTSDGVIVATALTSNSTTVNLVSTADWTQIEHLYVGQVIDIGTVASPRAVADSRTITAVSESGLTITISGAAVTTATTDRIFLEDAAGDSSAQRELTGLQTIVDSTGALFNLNPATAGQENWKAYESAVSGPVSENAFATAEHEVVRRSGEAIDVWIANYGVHRAYANLLTAQKRQTNTLELKGGYLGLEVAAGHGSKPLVEERMLASGVAIGFSTKHLIKFVETDWKWADGDGSVLHYVSGEAAYEALLYNYSELATDMRSSAAKLTGITTA